MENLFDSNDRYTQYGLNVAKLISPICEALVSDLLRQGYTLRTVMIPASIPTVDASVYNVDPETFKALWMLEVMDICLMQILTNDR